MTAHPLLNRHETVPKPAHWLAVHIAGRVHIRHNEDSWAVLTDNQSRYTVESNTYWTAQVEGPDFKYTIDNGLWNPGRWVSASSSAGIICAKPCRRTPTPCLNRVKLGCHRTQLLRDSGPLQMRPGPAPVRARGLVVRKRRRS
jgi:hypothetical protein